MAQYSSILRDEYNTIQSAVSQVLGQTAAQSTFGATGDDYGYGQSPASTAAPVGSPITALQWQNLTKDVLRCLYHQNGTNLGSVFASAGNVSGSAVVSGYPYTTTVTTTATATSAITNYITVGTTANMTVGMTIVFTGTTFGNIVSGTTYYILNIISASQLTICTASPRYDSAAFVLTTVSSGSMTVTADGSKGQYILDVDRATLSSYTSTSPSNIVTNRLVAPPSGVGITYPQGILYQYAVTGQLPAQLNGAVSPWKGTKSHTITIPFGSHNAARYFFNSGGYFAFKLTLTNIGSPGQSSYQLNLTWSTMFSAVDTFVFAARSCYITGTAQTSGSGTTYSKWGGGFYNLTPTSTATILTVNSPSGTYSVNDYLITANYDGGGNLYFSVVLNDDYVTGNPTFGTTELVTGSLSSILSVYYASGQDVNGDNTVVITRPTATSTSF